MKLSKLLLGSTLGASLVISASSSSYGQDVDLSELVRQVRRNMVQVEKDMDRLQTGEAREAGKEAKKNLDELIRSMKVRGTQVADDIEEIVKNIPS